VDLKNPSSELNDAIRSTGSVTLSGDFGGFKDFDPIVTRNAGYADKTFDQLLGKDPAQRYEIIMNEATLVEDLDI
jgi:hypothetical protein